jgi:RNA polymerase sigma-70 factor (ECF subfamily)
MRVIEQEIVDELEFHIEMRTLDNQNAGMPPREARQDALRRFGNIERIHKACRRTLLGERIMLQRIQAVLTLILLGAVIFMGVELYRGQRANEAATALMIQRLEKLAEKPAATPDDAAAVVVQTTPSIGDTDVDPALTEIRVTYNKEMMDGSWSWSQVTDEPFPETTGKPRYEADHKTCVLPVKLYPGKTYTIWLNSEKFGNFKDVQGRSAVPFLLRFATRQ